MTLFLRWGIISLISHQESERQIWQQGNHDAVNAYGNLRDSMSFIFGVKILQPDLDACRRIDMYILLLILIYIAFISLGLPDSLLGSGWPAMHIELKVPVA